MTTFDDWYSLYPRKVARKAAEKAWSRVATSPEVIEQIMSGLRAQLPYMIKTYRRDRSMVPHPATWLNGRRFEDDVNPVTAQRLIACQKCADTGQILVGPPALEIRRCSCHPLAGETLQAIHPEDWREYQRVLSACVGSAR